MPLNPARGQPERKILNLSGADKGQAQQRGDM